MLLQIPTATRNLATLLTKENAVEAIKEFLLYFENGNVLTLAAEIKAQDVLLDVKRQVGSGEALWLWDQGTGEDEIRKLITDYKIVAASNRIINSRASSLHSCLQEWREKAMSIKIPCTALVAEIPSLKAFFLMLRDIAEGGELPYDKRRIFLSELETNANPIKDFLASKTDVFESVYSFHLTGFSVNEVIALYGTLPMTTFTLNKSESETNVATLAEKRRREQEKYKLHQLWEEKTSTKTPKEWSSKNRTPILALVPVGLQSDARRVFDTINKSNPEDAEVKFSLEFLQSEITFFADLTNKSKINDAFTKDIIRRFVAVLPDVDEVRFRLETVVPSEHYYWYSNPTVQREVERFAQARYNLGGVKKVLDKIEKMDDRKAKAYLKRLIKDNMYVGIEILLEGGNET